jgi:hypothetical protein
LHYHLKPCCVLSGRVELSDETENHDADDPDQSQDYGDAIEVALGNSGCAEIGGDSATEHVREASTASTVQKNEKGQQKARDTEHYLQDNLKNFHEKPFWRVTNRCSV